MKSVLDIDELVKLAWQRGGSSSRRAAARRPDLAVAIGDPGEKDVLTLDPDLPDMEIATQLFLNGCLLDWEIFFPDDQGTLITLNPYPFAHTAHWIPA